MLDGVKTSAPSNAAADSPVPSAAAAAAAHPPTPRARRPAAPSSPSADGGSPLPDTPWVNRMLALPRAVRR